MAMGGIILPVTVDMEPTPIPLAATVFQGIRILGVKICNRHEYDAMFRFCVRHGVRPMVEEYPMTAAGLNQAIADLKGGNVRYRAVAVA